MVIIELVKGYDYFYRKIYPVTNSIYYITELIVCQTACYFNCLLKITKIFIFYYCKLFEIKIDNLSINKIKISYNVI